MTKTFSTIFLTMLFVLWFREAEAAWSLSALPACRVEIDQQLKKEAEPQSLCDAVLSDHPVISNLKGAQIKFTFPRPVEIKTLGIPRVGWGDWSIPLEIELQVNDKSPRSITLSGDRVTPGSHARTFDNIDIINLSGKPVSSITLLIGKVEGVNPWGTLELTTAKPAPPEIDFNDTGEIPVTAAGIQVDLQASADSSGGLIRAAYRNGTRNEMAFCSLPPLKQGLNRVQILWEDFIDSTNPEFPLNPTAYQRVEFAAENDELQLLVTDWSFIPAKESIPTPVNTLLPVHSPPDKDGWLELLPMKGFGRFGWIPSNGLLVGSMHENCFEYAINKFGKTKRSFDIIFSCGRARERIWNRISADWTGLTELRKMRINPITMEDLNAHAPQLIKKVNEPERLTYSSLAPGFLYDSQRKSFEMELAAQDETPWVLYIGTDGPVWLEPGKNIAGSEMAEGFVLVFWPHFPGMPVLVAPRHIPNLISTRSGFSMEFENEVGRVAVGTPAGYYGWNGKIQSLSTKTKELLKTSRWLASVLRAYPRHVSVMAKDSADFVQYRERVSYILWKNDWHESGSPIAPVSPLLSFAGQNGYGVKFADTIQHSGIATKVGPYSYYEGNQSLYALKKPPTGTTIYPAPTEQSEYIRTWAKHAATFPDPGEHPNWIGSQCLDAWWMRSPSSSALPLMTADERSLFLKNWKTVLENQFKPGRWILRREPYSDADYVISFGWKEVSTETYGDVNSGLGGFLQGIHAYARSSGDWGLVADNWKYIDAAYRYFLVQHDWVQMQTGAREHSGSSAIDMDGIGFEGALGYYEMATVLGKEEARLRSMALLARLAVPTSMRWLGHKWVSPHTKREDMKSLGVGFNEFSGFDMLGFSPWGPDHFNSELALTLAWAGEFPELYRLHAWGTGTEFFTWLENVLVEQIIPDWRKNYPGNRNNHMANVSDHLYMRGWLGLENSEGLLKELKAQAWTKTAPKGEAAHENAPLLAMVASQDAPVVLRSWGTAPMPEFIYNLESGALTVTATCPESTRLQFEFLRAINAKATTNGNENEWITSGKERALLIPKGTSTTTIKITIRI